MPWFSAILRFLAGAFALASLAVLALWTLSRLITDRFAYSQYLFWVPSHFFLLLAAGLLLLALPLRLKNWNSPNLALRGRTPVWAARLLLLTVIANALAALAYAGLEVRLLNAVWPTAAQPQRSVRLVGWNLTTIDAWEYGRSFATLTPSGTGAEARPDALFLTTTQRRAPLQAAVAGRGPDYSISAVGPFTVVSRLPLLAPQGSIALPVDFSDGATRGLDPTISQADRLQLENFYNRWADRLGFSRREFHPLANASVSWVTLDTTAQLGRPVVVWMLDLPSDPFRFRWRSAVAVAVQLRRLAASGGAPPAPDLVIGDFNTPRGSASIDHILTAARALPAGPQPAGRPAPGELTHAFNHAGWGLPATWPRATPLLHIDHCYLAPWLRASQYHILRPLISDHNAQYVEITPR
ncbi:MAG: hypothetical protein ACK51N_06530 [bacterium]